VTKENNINPSVSKISTVTDAMNYSQQTKCSFEIGIMLQDRSEVILAADMLYGVGKELS
jgi:hypothetical protein